MRAATRQQLLKQREIRCDFRIPKKENIFIRGYFNKTS